ncbi:MAG TPA: acetate uptake transporter [Actinomycetes bacterium]
MADDTIRPAAAIADPAPLGLGAFALTTFILSAHNAGWAPDLIWVGPALFYGGLAQLLAGMWEFRNRNTFGSTAFSTYGAFWLSLAAFVVLDLFGKVPADVNVAHALGWFVLAFAIFNTYMLLWSMTINRAVFGVFLTLEVTEILLFLGFFAGQAAGDGLVMVGGWVGVLTALVAWYASAAGVANAMAERPVVPVGRPIWTMPTGSAHAGSPMPRIEATGGPSRAH